jgi:hypothetical protein
MALEGTRGAYPQLLRWALGLVAALFALFGVVGYGAFGPGLCSVILTSLPPGVAADVARVAMVVGLFFTCTYPRVGGWLTRTDGWRDAWMDGWMNGWIDGWMGGWMDGWMTRAAPEAKPPCH